MVREGHPVSESTPADKFWFGLPSSGRRRARASGKSYVTELRAHVASEAFLAGLSRNSRFEVARASFHQVHLYEPQTIASAIVQVVASVRSGKRLGRPR